MPFFSDDCACDVYQSDWDTGSIIVRLCPRHRYDPRLLAKLAVTVKAHISQPQSAEVQR